MEITMQRTSLLSIGKRIKDPPQYQPTRFHILFYFWEHILERFPATHLHDAVRPAVCRQPAIRAVFIA